MRYTKEQLLEGVDLKNLKKSIPQALETNEALRNVVLASFTNNMLIDASAFAESTMRGEKLAGELGLANFLDSADENLIRGVEEALGIENLREVSPEFLIYRSRIDGKAQGTSTAMVQTTSQTVAENTTKPINASVDTNVNLKN